ncbi:MAG TPA: trypsin-like peptidase domain-containing protein [Dehalococcoidia bacterium]|nr:trypsin-like peptidase domain-containing protein [Dehalococcoidia bacterium]
MGFFGQVQQTSGVGTGIIIDTDGHIVTNNHVVTLDSSQAANNLTVDLWDGRSLSARLVARDPSADLAVLQITAQNLTPAKFADPNSLQVGQDVVAIGYALDLGSTPSVTRGIISALHRDFTETITDVSGRPVQNTIGDVIQTDAAINEGNSGGPLVNLSGEVVGINTGAIRPSTTAANITSQVQGINYAISVQTILPVVRSLITKGNVDRGYLGVNLTQVDRNAASAKQLPVSDGVLISQVVPGGPADRAGLQANDIIVKAGNEDIHTVGDLQQVLIENGPGTKLHIEFYRGNNRQSADVTLGSRPAGT